MEGEAVNNIAAYAQQALEAERHIVYVDGLPYSTRELRPVRAVEPEPKPLTVSTLEALATFVRDEWPYPDEAAVVNVVSAQRVEVWSRLRGPSNQRFLMAVAQAPNRPLPSCIGQWVTVEVAIIDLMHRVEESPGRAALLAFLGNVRNEEVVTLADDGVSQQVAMKAGASSASAVAPGVVALAPFRTFSEVQQPTSSYVLRLRKGDAQPLVALYEADGGAWVNDAIRSIANRLAELLEGESFTLLA